MKRSGFVVIAGRPNAGKSTLMNRIVGSELSIVTPKAQTTRERVLGILTEKKIGQMVFIDTPGIHRAKEGGINAYMMSEVKEALEGTHLVWYLVDPNSKLTAETVVLDLLAAMSGSKIFLLMNKCDLKFANGELLLPLVLKAAEERGVVFEQILHVSAYKGRGIAELLAASWPMLPEGPFHYPDLEQVSDRPLRFFAAEKIREQLLLNLGEELPYSCAVELVKFDEAVKPLRIEAIIHVERDSQKGMVVGKGGLKIKDIGMNARKSIESFLGEKIFLGLQVKVLEDWSKNADALERLGYHLPAGARGSKRKGQNKSQSKKSKPSSSGVSTS